jgi:hypothetical protein
MKRDVHLTAAGGAFVAEAKEALQWFAIHSGCFFFAESKKGRWLS